MYLPNPFDSSDEGLVQAASLSVGAFAVLSSMGAFAGIAFGLRSMMLARRVGRPIALGLSGVLLCILSIGAWTSFTLLWFAYAQLSNLGGYGSGAIM